MRISLNRFARVFPSVEKMKKIGYFDSLSPNALLNLLDTVRFTFYWSRLGFKFPRRFCFQETRLIGPS